MEVGVSVAGMGEGGSGGGGGGAARGDDEPGGEAVAELADAGDGADGEFVVGLEVKGEEVAEAPDAGQGTPLRLILGAGAEAFVAALVADGEADGAAVTIPAETAPGEGQVGGLFEERQGGRGEATGGTAGAPGGCSGRADANGCWERGLGVYWITKLRNIAKIATEILLSILSDRTNTEKCSLQRCNHNQT